MNIDELPLSRLRVLRVRDESVLFDADLAGLYWETLLSAADERTSEKNHRTILA